MVSGTTIESLVYNGQVDDVTQDLNWPRPIVAGGTGANNAADAAANLGVVTGKAAMTYTETEKATARKNIYAAPLDALAYNGMQVNGSMDVSQENGTTGVNITHGTIKYVVDGFMGYLIGSGSSVQISQFPITNLPGFNNAFRMAALNNISLAGSTDLQALLQNIEGYRWSRLGFGTASAQSVTIGFWAYVDVAGTLAVSLRNDAANLSYVVDVPVVASAWQYKTVTIPGETTGTWPKNNLRAAVLTFCFGSGSANKTTANTWAAGNFVATAATTNFLPSTGQSVYITGVVVLPGTQAPTAAQSSLIMRPFDQELATCLRYYEKDPGRALCFSGNVANGSYYATTATYKVIKRTAPTSVVNFVLQSGNFSAAAPVYNYSASSFEIEVACTSSATYAYYMFSYIANARL